MVILSQARLEMFSGGCRAAAAASAAYATHFSPVGIYLNH